MIKDITLKELKELNDSKNLIIKFCFNNDFDVYDLNGKWIYSLRVLK